MRLYASILLLLGILALAGAAGGSTPPQILPAGFERIEQGPAGGAVWQGLIGNPTVPSATRPTLVYLPPGFTRSHPYPVLYLLHGFPGSPYSFIAALQLAQTADTAIASGGLPPFIAVIPPAGFDAYHGAWTGIWEDFVVRTVVPWVDANLPSGHPRTLAGLSSGGYGALDIGLRHPGTFDRLEAWSGYFHPIREGSLLGASTSELAAHDPSLLVSREGPLLRSAGVRFFLSAGTTQDRPTAAATVQFAAQLRRLGLQTSVWLGPGGHDSFFWRRQLPAALRFAVAPG